MKKIIKFSLVLVVALITMNVHAGTVDFTLVVKKEQGKLVTFALDKMNKVDLSIYDADGKIVHSEKVTSRKIINRTYDLKALPEGTYYLEAESEMKIAKYKISVVGDTATLSDTAVSEIYKPVFGEKAGLISLSILNLDKSSVDIKIYDDEQNEVYASDKLMNQNISKFFDIKNIKSEKYIFEITYADKTFTKTFPN
ncbi:T9SS type A sorting domain-containing protein [Flavobacterium soyangense]|uniref:T9SS type A sorting domain-containing protein n=1 Tax=Flavobacterium soyangense TaxID=2023265 RepID=A0A930XUK3_9FLAO|nr:T9SS type A sorting domain-containing protein [Flavobacterium soyangense]MBF2707102.1 T9SS type A sorting domain-containing protein [Flavobacterium soyangense]